MVEFIAVGEAMLDVVAAAGARHGRVTVRAGGTAVNAALAAAALGASAAVVARVGADAAGAAIRAALQEAGVATIISVDDELPTGCFVQIGEEIVVDRGASARLAARDVRFPQADALLVSGYALLQEDTRAAAEAALTAGATWTAVDVGALRTSVDALGSPRVVFANREEARALTGRDGEDAARALADRFEIACVKLDAEGAVAAHAGRVARVPGVASAGDAVGVGDAFDAGVLVALARHASLQDALDFGARAAAHWCLERA